MLRKKRGGGPTLPNTDTAGPSNVINTRDNLLGLEDLAHGADEHGIPFILVDAVACTTRCDLDKALNQLEQKRMEHVIRHIEDSMLPMLDGTKPPPELDMTITLSAEALAEVRAAEEERRFLKDMSDLTFWTPEEEQEEIGTNPTTTAEEPLAKSKTDLEQVRLKLEKLVPSPEGTAVSTTKRPGIQRQGTFEIKRKKEDKNMGSENTKGAKTTEGQKCTEKPPDNPKEFSRTQQIINQVGDLLVEFSTQNQKNRVLTEGASYSYMVTISPVNGASNCVIQAMKEEKSSNIKDAKHRQNQPVSGQLPISQNPQINIFAPPNRVRPEASASPNVIERKSHGPGASIIQPSTVKFVEQRSRSQLLAKVPCSFLKVPAPAKYCHGRMRD